MAGPADPLARLDVDLLSHETDLRAPVVELNQGILGLVVIDRLLREPSQGPEFENERSDLGGVGTRAVDLPGPKVHEPVRHARGGIEYGKQPRPQILGEPEQAPITGHLVAGEQSPQEADRHLEILHRDVLVE